MYTEVVCPECGGTIAYNRADDDEREYGCDDCGAVFPVMLCDTFVRVEDE